MRRRARGFTLIEVLVALVVLGALFLSLVQGLRFETSALAMQQRLGGAGSDLDTLDRTFRRLVAHMDPGVPLQPPLLHADAHTLAFTTELPEAAGALAAQAADVSLGVDAGKRLVLRWRSHFPGGEAGAAHELELLRGVDHVDFAYWRPDPGAWLPRWPDAAALPGLVRLTVVPASRSGTARTLPPMVAAPMRDPPL